MAKEARIGVFVVGLDAEAAHKVANRENDTLGFAIFEQAFVRIDHAMRSAFVHAAQNTHLTCLFVPYADIRRHDLVAIVTRVVHAQNGPHRRFGVEQAVEKAFDFTLLAFQLLGVRHGKPFATAAFAIDGAEKGSRRDALSSAACTKLAAVTSRRSLGEFGRLARFVRLVRLVRLVQLARAARFSLVEASAHRGLSALAFRFCAVECDRFAFRRGAVLRATAFRHASLVDLARPCARLATLGTSPTRRG